METKNSKSEEKVKTCTLCGNSKPIDEFGKLAASKDGHLMFCKVCNQARNKDYRLSVINLTGKATPKAPAGIDWSKAPVFEHEVRVNNDCVIGEYAKNASVNENFVLKISVWDKDENDVKKIVETHTLYVKADEWKKMLDFPQAKQMISEVNDVKDTKWVDFVFHYTKVFGQSLPNNPVGLRFKKCGTNGKCVNVGFNLKNLPALKAKFSK